MEFEKLLLRATTRYYHLDNLQTTFSQIKLKPILFALEADLNTIHLHQLKLFGPQICLTHKMGLLTKQCTGYWISYLNKDNTKNLQTLIPDLPSDYDSEFFSNLGKYAPENLFYSVSVSIEESSRSNFFPVCSGIRNLQDDGSVLFSSVPLNPSSEAVGPVQLTFVLWLSPPVPITIASKHKIFTFQNSPPGKTNNRGTGVPLSLLLTNSIQPNTQQTIHGFKQMYSSKINEEENAVVIRRIPFTFISQIPHIIEYLRQHVVFNELYQNCFKPRQQTSRKRKFDPENAGTFNVEVSAHPPHFIGLHFSSTPDILTNLEIHISTNGNLSCDIQVHPTGSPLMMMLENKFQEISKEIEETRDIPFVVSKYWLCNTDT
eukprot:TRINITY_DN5194_c0_g1_i15.p1 TRINITY_DN5194_c0_g1~~TRINITY_DN5194_c0_g1_i15.p1  ORF type:complete len:375 (-),score=60.06 TRINITY_DN5194_c0_g1_i15:98-1222(-)